MANIIETLAEACKVEGLAEVPPFMRGTFSRGHRWVPRYCEGLWSLTTKEGDKIVFLDKETITIGLWSPTAEGVSIPSEIRRMNVEEFLEFYEFQKQAVNN